MTWQPSTDAYLPNGLRVVVLPSRASRIVEACLLFAVHTPHPHRRAQIAMLGTCLLDACTPIRAGLTLTVQPGAESLLIRAGMLSGRLPDFFVRLALPLTRPRYDTASLARARDSLVHRTTAAAPYRQRADLLRRRFIGHPLAVAVPTRSTLQGVSVAQLEAAHARTVVPQGALLVVAGDVDAREVLRLAAETWSGWDGPPATAPTPPIRVRPGAVPPELTVDHAAPYATAFAAAPAPGPVDPRFPAALLTAQVLADARLTRALADRFPHVLAATCAIEHSAAGAWLSLGVDVLDAGVDELVDIVVATLDRFVDRPPTAAELRAAQAFAFRSTVTAQAGTAQAASACARAVSYGLAPTFWLSLPGVLATTTVEQAAEAAKRYFTPTAFAVAAVGSEMKRVG